MLESLERVWLRHPDLRFFQLVSLIAQWANYPNDPFYCEDDKLLEAIKFKLELENEKIS